MTSRVEALARQADEAAQDRPTGPTPRAGVQSWAYVHVPAGVHPEHGEPCVFVPGELLPGWAARAVAGRLPDDRGVIDLGKGTGG